MTFVEELKKLSEQVELQHKLDRQLAEIKTKMRASAKHGYRCFKIEIFTLDLEALAVYLPDDKAENYYCFYTTNESLYAPRLFEFLAELGFDPTEVHCIKRSSGTYNSTLLSVLW